MSLNCKLESDKKNSSYIVTSNSLSTAMSEALEHGDVEEDIFDVEEISNIVKYNIENNIGKIKSMISRDTS